MERFYLLDLERTVLYDRLYFWKQNKRGYTNHIEDAGLFFKEIAAKICEADLDNGTIMIPEKGLIAAKLAALGLSK
jgi:hypothetical protein